MCVNWQGNNQIFLECQPSVCNDSYKCPNAYALELYAQFSFIILMLFPEHLHQKVCQREVFRNVISIETQANSKPKIKWADHLEAVFHLISITALYAVYETFINLEGQSDNVNINNT